MASQGPLYPSQAADLGGGSGGFLGSGGPGSGPWQNTSNLFSADGSYAGIASTGGGITSVLGAWGYGFTIPLASTINGILFELIWNGPSTSSDSTIQLMKIQPTLVGTNKATSTAAPASNSTFSYGSSSDMWGLSLAPADINGVNFGAAFQAASSASNGQILVDTMRITVTYTAVVVGSSRRRMMV